MYLFSFDRSTFHTNSGNWVRDGDILTTPEGYVQVFYQSFASWLAFQARHAPEAVMLQVDLDKLRECFSVRGSNGARIQPTAWDLRPEPQFFDQRQQAVSAWRAHTDKYGSILPYLAHKSLNAPKEKKTGTCDNLLWFSLSFGHMLT